MLSTSPGLLSPGSGEGQTCTQHRTCAQLAWLQCGEALACLLPVLGSSRMHRSCICPTGNMCHFCSTCCRTMLESGPCTTRMRPRLTFKGGRRPEPSEEIREASRIGSGRTACFRALQGKGNIFSKFILVPHPGNRLSLCVGLNTWPHCHHQQGLPLMQVAGKVNLLRPVSEHRHVTYSARADKSLTPSTL